MSAVQGKYFEFAFETFNTNIIVKALSDLLIPGHKRPVLSMINYAIHFCFTKDLRLYITTILYLNLNHMC